MKLSASISRLEYGVYALSLILCFLLFKHTDLSHTNNSSFAYLQGHFWDFYDYNRPLFMGNNYLPFLYWIFAVWNIPLKLLGQLSAITSDTWMLSTVIQTIWSKLLLAIFFFSSIAQIKKISEQLYKLNDWTPSNLMAFTPYLLFATSPIAIYSVFIFSGYDIFGLFFSLVGLRFYFAKDFNKFVFWFSVAISFKFFAAIIYLPLVLIIEKRLSRLVLYGLAGLAFTIFQLALYWHSEAFHLGIFGMIEAKAGGHTMGGRFFYANIIYFALCIFLYASKFNFQVNSYRWCQTALLSCVLSYALFFSWVMWHPQWLFLTAPFVCLSYLFIRNKNLLLIVEILGYLGFLIFTINNWIGNADNVMLYSGALASWLPKTQTIASDVMGRHWLGFARTAFYTMLYAPALIWFSEYLWSKKISVGHEEDSHQKSQSRFTTALFIVRFLVGTYFFVVICAICLYRA